ncbi:hypothetical protein BU24DRAFT_196537 [Aaosphaeria arxii CBS 175.79]|uniref:Uncharacterized protein n=1 Tax=Aaosphaeria arxii CBS 175.79 TaxID=1450172 RepID=A0A6A5XTC2_9PLEO|nr:uncharacterized protein BU24DRAFT_196537 [Aaosphaeria arxii CBS 175.79]KAF2016193.1 hypothetical protein BU24DRAFT_196537 [Aaosphaeria arxii CBS 175.79]
MKAGKRVVSTLKIQTTSPDPSCVPSPYLWAVPVDYRHTGALYPQKATGTIVHMGRAAVGTKLRLAEPDDGILAGPLGGSRHELHCEMTSKSNQTRVCSHLRALRIARKRIVWSSRRRRKAPSHDYKYMYGGDMPITNLVRIRTKGFTGPDVVPEER